MPLLEASLVNNNLFPNTNIQEPKLPIYLYGKDWITQKQIGN